jgi:hypothetical protein
MMEPRWMSWVRMVVLGALVAVSVVVAIRAEPSASVDIGTAIQSLDPRAGDGAARHTEQVTYHDDDLELSATYLATDGRLQGTIAAEHRVLWNIAGRVLPAEQLDEIRQLSIVTDGPDGTLGMVHRSGSGRPLILDGRAEH